ncbi:MAG: hypothetical protein HC781_19355 [Leptolyngbyaceae cyanobacterium CSU_1_4]|nr:hypothetical protein [Leptolyngbyaceae cyanobacterium CSU_1_4]
MDNRPGSGTNGNGHANGNGNGNGNGRSNGRSNGSLHSKHFSKNGSYPVLERRWRHMPKTTNQRSLPLLPVAILCLAIGVAVGITTLKDSNLPTLKSPSSQTDTFRWAVNRAMSAAEITQIAKTKDEWLTIVDWWKESIRLMQSVAYTSEDRKVAQEKVKEYQQNLAYAQRKSQAKDPVTSATLHLWTRGSRKADVLRIQGKPTQSVRYDALCQEVLTYGNSTVELNNSIVVNFEDIDRNLKTAKESMPTTALADGLSWTLGSDKEDVFKVQGTPGRVERYDAPSKEILHYGNSTVQITDNRVTSYANFGGNLKVAVRPLPSEVLSDPNSQPNFWSLGADRNEIFRVQGTPTEVSLDGSSCREELRYGNSMVELQNGVVAGYDNSGGNLSVQVK